MVSPGLNHASKGDVWQLRLSPFPRRLPGAAQRSAKM